MVQVKPFKGVRYATNDAASLATKVAPPYDVISPEQQTQLYNLDPANVVRLILGQTTPNDSETSNVYTRAHDTLEAWLREGVLTTEAAPAFYGYSQTWQGVQRNGFIGLLGCEPFENGTILPHEWTLGGPKADRLALMQATGTVLSPIFCLYDDRQATMDWSPPANALTFTDGEGVTHQFWPVTDPAICRQVETMMAQQTVLIADGHHRYETALTYRDWRRTKDGLTTSQFAYGQLPCDYTMAFFTNMADPGLRVYPTHRVFHQLPAPHTAASFIQQIETLFSPCADTQALFWVQTPSSAKQGYRLSDSTNISHLPGPFQTLDVALIDALLFEGVLKASANDLKQQGHLSFIRNEEDVATVLATEPESLILWVHAPSMKAIRDVCQSGLRMPQKSTYFYPKLLSGLVMHYYGVNPLSPLFPQESAISVS